MGSLGILLAVVGVAGALVLLLLFWYFWSARRRIRSEIERHTRTLMDAVCSSFLTTSCSRCHESEMRLLSVTPNARAIEYQCVYCNKKMFGTACAPEAGDARLAWEQLTSATLEATRQGFNSFEGDFDLVWTVLEDPPASRISEEGADPRGCADGSVVPRQWALRDMRVQRELGVRPHHSRVERWRDDRQESPAALPKLQQIEGSTHLESSPGLR